MARKPKTYPEEVENAFEELSEELVVSVSEPITNEPSEDLQPTPKDLAAAKSLTGSAKTVEIDSVTADRLIRLGIAADAGDGQLMRGFRWQQFVK